MYFLGFWSSRDIYVFKELLYQPCTFFNNHRDVMRVHMTCQILTFHCTQDEEQGINSMLEFINLANLDDKSECS